MVDSMRSYGLAVAGVFDVTFSQIVSPGMDASFNPESLFDILQVLDHHGGKPIRELIAQCAIFVTLLAQPGRAEKKRLGPLNCARTG